MKIIQITDLHLGTKDQRPYDIDVRKNFTDILREVRTEEPDHLVISGDLCFDMGDPTIYKWVKNRLALQKFPWSIITGNHDDTKMLSDVFEFDHLLTDDELFFAKKIGKTTCLFLDTAKGFCREAQLNWLRRQLRNHKKELILFMHHPPIKVGMPFMDSKHAFKDIKTLKPLLLEYPSNLHIFCGHYHIDKTVRLKNLTINVTPSCFYQLNQQSPEFKVDHHRIGMRVIEVTGESVRSYVRYFEGN